MFWILILIALILLVTEITYRNLQNFFHSIHTRGKYVSWKDKMIEMHISVCPFVVVLSDQRCSKSTTKTAFLKKTQGINTIFSVASNDIKSKIVLS